MFDRVTTNEHIMRLVNQYNITQTAVGEIIDCYLRYCKDLLVTGNRVEFFGLATVIPDYEVSGYSTTLAYECDKIADVLHLPRHTVYAVVSSYIDNAVASVLSGSIVTLRGILTVKPIMDEFGEITRVHSNISNAMKLRLNEVDTKVTGFRVHTNKYLKKQIRESA